MYAIFELIISNKKCFFLCGWPLQPFEEKTIPHFESIIVSLIYFYRTNMILFSSKVNNLTLYIILTKLYI